MNESIQQPLEPTEELATLRRVNAELLAKSATRKSKIAELEITAVTLQGKLTESESTIYDLSVTRPLNAMAESISIAPDVFLEHLNKSYRVDMLKGELSLLTPDGTPVTDDAGKAVPFTREGLSEFLKDPKNPQAKLFSSILIQSRATGAGGGFGEIRKSVSAPTTVAPPRRSVFGLR